ncbi:MAG: hypothetical protein AAGI52_13865 [Bacteroidota bacterium]
MRRAVPLLLALATLAACGEDLPPAPDGVVHEPARKTTEADWEMVLDLAGTWDFRIGDRTRWRREGPPETGWDAVAVPSAWEDAGYHGYDGFAWYRRIFTLKADMVKRTEAGQPVLLLGQIDDSDEVWLDGVYLGRGGRMPPSYATGFFEHRAYRIPPGLLRADTTHTLTVRVYDGGREGGILAGPIGVAVPAAGSLDAVPFVADLAGDWLFSVDDDPSAALPGEDTSSWDAIRVPGTWENQGFGGVDGYAWYRRTVSLSAAEAAQDLVLVLGAVDDLDQSFVNGVEVGRTGDPDSQEVRDDEWLRERAYPISPGLLREGDNVIAVRVYDGAIEGGIHLGPVGLMTAENYAERLRRYREANR